MLAGFLGSWTGPLGARAAQPWWVLPQQRERQGPPTAQGLPSPAAAFLLATGQAGSLRRKQDQAPHHLCLQQAPEAGRTFGAIWERACLSHEQHSVSGSGWGEARGIRQSQQIGGNLPCSQSQASF